LKEAHKTATANQLEEMIKKHPELYKIHQQKSTASGNVLEKAYSNLASYFGNVFELTKQISKLYQDTTFNNIFSNKDNVEAFLKIADTNLDPKANIAKACVILEGILDTIKYSNKPEITKLLEDKKKEWDPANSSCKKNQPQPGQPKKPGQPPNRQPKYGAPRP
jgi:hypothetical protein